jgi:hypothetical protein
MILVAGAVTPLQYEPNSRIKIVADTQWKRFYEEHVAFLDARDHERLVLEHYHPDGMVISTEYQVHGHAELFKHFAKYSGLMAHLAVVTTDKWIESDHTFAFEATARTQWGLSRVHDAFVLQDGKIKYHFTGSIPLVR